MPFIFKAVLLTVIMMHKFIPLTGFISSVIVIVINITVHDLRRTIFFTDARNNVIMTASSNSGARKLVFFGPVRRKT